MTRQSNPRRFLYVTMVFVLLSIFVVLVVYLGEPNKNKNVSSFLQNQLRGSTVETSNTIEEGAEQEQDSMQRSLGGYEDDFVDVTEQQWEDFDGTEGPPPQKEQKKKKGDQKKTKDKKKKKKKGSSSSGGGSSSAWGDYGADPLDPSKSGSKTSSGSSSFSSGRDPYGGKESSYGGYGSSSSSSSSPYGSSSSSGYGSSSSSSYGSTSGYGSSTSSSSSYGGYGSSSSSYGSGSYGSSSSWGGSKSSKWSSKDKVSMPVWGIILGATVFFIATAGGMIYTAYQFERKPEGEVQAILMPDEEGDEYTDDEIERMKLRPGIAKALEREHNKAFRKNESKSSIELKKITKK